jgi:O-6-methylguanine DNA methyltransferase
MNSSKAVYRLVAEIPEGMVMTYGQMGGVIGIHSRLVGRILHENPDPIHIPCHRVVSSRGEVAKSYAFGGGVVQEKKLRKENVKFVGNKVNLKKCLYKSNH